MASVTGVVAAAPAGRLVAAGGVSVVLPGSWLLLDVAGERRIADEVAVLLEQAAAADASVRAGRGRLGRQLRAVVASARREPVVLAAVQVGAVGDAPPLVASVTVAVVDGRGDAGLSRAGARVSTVELPAGPAVLRRFSDSASDARVGVSVRAAVWQWLVPMPDARRRVVLMFACPDTAPVLAEAMADLFAAVAESLAFTDPQPSSTDPQPSSTDPQPSFTGPGTR